MNQTDKIIHQVDSSFNFKLFQPKGRMSACVQAVWSTSISNEASGSIKRWLQGDACGGFYLIWEDQYI